MRDTDKDWNNIAASRPYYGVVTLEKFLSPDEEALDEFFRTGEEYVSQEYQYITKIYPDFTPSSALDFGCGVGRLAIPLARLTGNGCGIDIADNMLTLASEHARRAGVNLSLRKDVPIDLQFDWVNSFIVLQHIPPERGYEIIQDLWNCVAPDGMLAIQLTIYKDAVMAASMLNELGIFSYDGNRIVTHRTPNVEEGHISMYDYDLARVFAIFDLEYGHQVFMRKTNHGGCHGFHIYVRKAAAS
ncbi:class I SAM-dependent methyltransferase [Sphingobium sp. AP49]|uniref:class I SAM-dependent methyltransferase n=1 Tax=Sphingobium sp. AP49 TaxID=1144307 RepID=UPI00026ED134|nr:class I SAM-dependent methyltransferase [Sphingobium sp. AP49]WHO40446.1 class I SAM-dependent methyltransferase [Sphingobium sp. AP49]